MWKKAFAMMASVMLVFTFCFSVSAQTVDASSNGTAYVDNSGIELLMQYTKSTKTTLSISNKQASAAAIFNGYNGTTTKVTITMTLQKKGLLGLWWSDETSWTETFNSYSAAMNRKYTVSGGTYRVKAVYTAYSGTKSETTTDYSAEVKC